MIAFFNSIAVITRIPYTGIVTLFICIIGQIHAADIYIPKSQIKHENEPSYFIISIGVNNYEDEYWSTLKWPASDATRIADKLGIGTNKRRTTRLIINETATLDKVKNALQDIRAQAQANDTVILYISGHGTLAQTENGELERVFLLHDSRQDDLFTTALPFSILQNWLNGLHSRKNLMILATCHSGEGKSRLPLAVQEVLRSTKGKLISLSDVSEGALILTAAAHGEAARENDKLQGDIYTYYFLEALNTYDRNKDGVISALEAHDYARDRTWVFSNGRQRPTASIKLIGDADIPLLGTKNQQGLPILEAYSIDLAGFMVSVDGNTKGPLPSAFPLDPNGSLISLYPPQSDTAIAKYKVKAKPGQHVSLDRVMTHRPIRISSAIVQSHWADPSWNQLTGSPDTSVFEFSASYQLGPFGLGVVLGIPYEKTNTIQEPIESEVSLDSTSLFAEYRYRRANWSFIPRLELGREKLSIQLTDKSQTTPLVSNTLEFSDTSIAFGLSLITAYNFRKDLSLTASFGQRNNDWVVVTNPNANSQRQWDINGKRRWFSIGLNYRFGWIARTIK